MNDLKKEKKISKIFLSFILSFMFIIVISQWNDNISYANVKPNVEFKEFALNGDGKVKAIWNQEKQTLTITGEGKIELDKWIELSRKFHKYNYDAFDAWKYNNDFTMEFVGGKVQFPDNTAYVNSGKDRSGFFQTFAGEIILDKHMDVSNVKDMSYMFAKTEKANPDVSEWNVSSVENMRGIFSGAEKANPNVRKWAVSNVKDMSYMFSGTKEANPDVSEWNVSSVKNMKGIFSGAEKANPNVRKWAVSNVKDMSYMFSGTKEANPDVSEWNVSSVENMRGIFSGAEKANPNVSKWNVSNVKNMLGMFSGTKEANPDVSEWDVSNVEDMSSMFEEAKQANPDVSKWNVSNVRNMSSMFEGAKKANPDVSKWKAPKLKLIQRMFFRAGAVKRIDLSNIGAPNLSAYFTFISVPSIEVIKIKGLRNVDILINKEDYIIFDLEKNEKIAVKAQGPKQIADGGSYIIYLESLKNKVSLDTDGGSSIEDIEVKYAEKFNQPQDPKKEGHKFIEWQLLGQKYDFDKLLFDNITLKAKWEPLKYKVNFNTDGGNEISEVEVSYGQQVKKPQDPVREGYKFVEWQLSDNEYDFNLAVTTDIILKAKWEPLKYKVSFNTDGGNEISEEELTYGQQVQRPQDPVKEGYKFVEWQLSGQKYEFNTPITENITLIAVWTKDAPVIHQVIFDTDGGSEITPINVISGKNASRPADPTKKGNKFTQWNLSDNKYEFDVLVTTDIILKAKWEPLKYKVSFNTDGGNEITEVEVSYGQQVQRPQDPVREGYKFVEWQLSGQKYEFNTPITENIILKAVWSKIESPQKSQENSGSTQNTESSSRTSGSSSGSSSIKEEKEDNSRLKSLYETITNQEIEDEQVPKSKPYKTKLIFTIGNKNYKITKEGKEEKKQMEITPFIEKSRTMLPVRYIAETLGLEVKWNKTTRTAILNSEDVEIKIPIDTNKLIVNGKEYKSDIKPIVKSGRMFMSISNIAKTLGLEEGKNIIWNKEKRQVEINY